MRKSCSQAPKRRVLSHCSLNRDSEVGHSLRFLSKAAGKAGFHKVSCIFPTTTATPSKTNASKGIPASSPPMDPISLTASVIAVVGATATIAKSLENLRRTLRSAASEISSLINEISDLRVVLGACETALRELHTNASVAAPTLLEDVEQVLSNTSTLLERLNIVVSSCADVEGAEAQKSRLAKLRWFRKKTEAQTLQGKLRESKQDMMLLLESHSVSAITGVQIAVQQISIGQEKFQTESTEKLETVLAEVTAHRRHSETIASTVSELHGKLDLLRHTRESSNNECGTSPVLPTYEDATGRRRSSGDELIDDEQSAVQFQAVCYRKSCRPWCSCRCHAKSTFKSPKLAKGLLGHLFVGLSGIPIVGTCNDRQCRQRSTLRFTLNYQFPKWLCERALFASFSTGTVAGPCMFLRLQSTIPYASEAYQSTIKGDVPGLQRLFRDGLASPFDVDPYGVSLLWYAMDSNHYSTCKLFISAGIDIYEEDQNGKSAWDYAWDSMLLNPQDTKRKQALLKMFPHQETGLDERQFSRIHKSVLGLVKSKLEDELVLSTAFTNTPDSAGRSPLHWAACRGDEKAVALLLNLGADPQGVTGKKGSADTPLHGAARAGHTNVVRLLLEHGAPVDARGQYDTTPLGLAAEFNDDSGCVQVLLTHGADVNAEDSESRTPLVVAAQAGMLANAAVLLKHGANINHCRGDCWTPLLSCVFRSQHDGIKWLLRCGASYMILTDDGDQHTFLHVAAIYADQTTLEILTQAKLTGLNVDAKNAAGKTALDLKNARTGEGLAWHRAFWELLQSMGKKGPFGPVTASVANGEATPLEKLSLRLTTLQVDVETDVDSWGTASFYDAMSSVAESVYDMV